MTASQVSGCQSFQSLRKGFIIFLSGAQPPWLPSLYGMLKPSLCKFVLVVEVGIKGAMGEAGLIHDFCDSGTLDAFLA